MGVPRFAAYLFKRFPQIWQMVQENQKRIKVPIDNLYIDANGIFHPCAAKVYNYGDPYKPLLRKRKLPHPRVLQKRLFERICLTIENLVKIIRPQKHLVICVDGVAGCAKQAQQRQRRFRSATERSDEDFNKFDSNQITPGTVFMTHLSKYIDWWIRTKLMNDPRFQNLKIVFSNDRVPGEGEHKIIKFIRKRLLEEPSSRSESHCIHGLDADLFMLSLSTHLPNIFLFRENTFDRYDNFYLVDVGQLRKDLIFDLKPDDDEYEENGLINDFVVMCFLVGNDFLPRIYCLDIIEGGIDTMIDIYKNRFDEFGHLTSTEENKKGSEVKLRYRTLRRMFKDIASLEATMIENKFRGGKSKFQDVTLEQSLTPHATEGYQLDKKKWKKNYYTRKFGCTNKDEKVQEVCRAYIDGLQWVASYYSVGIPSWTWVYPYHYAPLPHNIAKCLKKYRVPTFPDDRPLKPFQQLLSVLPPKSMKLLPPCFEPLFTAEDSPLADLYPSEFKVDREGCLAEWEGIALLPFIDLPRLLREYERVEEKNREVYPRDFSRNRIGSSTIYWRHPRVNYHYKNYNGDIPNCQVKTLYCHFDG